MDASAVKHQARLAEWRTLVAECRSSGKSVRAEDGNKLRRAAKRIIEKSV